MSLVKYQAHLPGAVSKQTAIAFSQDGRQSTSLPKVLAKSISSLKVPIVQTSGDRIRPGPLARGQKTWSIPTVRLWSRDAAARRATRRLPLGEPPLVITTHAITSFRSSHPELTRDQPRARSGSSPSCHVRTTRKPAVCCTKSRPTQIIYPPRSLGSTVKPEKSSGLCRTHIRSSRFKSAAMAAAHSALNFLPRQSRRRVTEQVGLPSH